jgi:hypothetical protein
LFFEGGISLENKTVLVSQNIKFKVDVEINLCNLNASFPGL